MSVIYADRVKETTTTTGTGTFSLGGAVAGFQTFVAGAGSGQRCKYMAKDRSSNDWEVGLGTVTSGAPDTLSRDLVLSSSNGGALVSFAAGTKDVMLDHPAELSKLSDISVRTDLASRYA